MPNTVGTAIPISSAEGAASSEEVRALITVLGELASKMDRILSMFDQQASDPRYSHKPTWKP